jgi:pimeloyl-ACP methyl ester carboxylesterase
VRHRFDELAFVAHSMGGLVSRGAILKYSEETQRDDVRLFVSISVPWGGDKRGVTAQAAPIEVPESFKDLNPPVTTFAGFFIETRSRRFRGLGRVVSSTTCSLVTA